MTADLLQLIESARGIETRDLWAEIVAKRRNELWPHKTPVDMQALQLTLFGLQSAGQIVLVAGDGWWLESQRPRVRPGARNLPAALFD